MLNKRRAEKVLEVVERELLTPYGLRTLSPDDPNYRGVYAGDQASRDSAYHQGTVWPWLIGSFITAYVKVKGEKTSKFLKALIEHLNDAGLDTISEVFDGDPPHTPGGCISQAWNVAEVLRCYIEDIGG
jgi:glycogen debranching enzyme